MSFGRRRFLGGAAASVAALALGGRGPAAAATPAIRPDDPEYANLVARGYNPRFSARPEVAFTPATDADTVAALQYAVDRGLQPAARSGGHCYADFVDNAGTRALLDLGRLDEVRYDPDVRAFAIGPGADLGSVYERLYTGWGVTLPGGTCLGVGMGGHACGGGFGALSRRFGPVVDHIYGVDVVVVVDSAGRAELVRATRDGPNRDLWWAHTGGGGGNFGVVTRYLMRSHDADGADPARSLPVPPRALVSYQITLPAAAEADFVTFARNYLRFFDRHRAAGSPFDGFYAAMYVGSLVGSFAQVTTVLDADSPDANRLHDEFVAELTAGVFPPPIVVPDIARPFLDLTTRFSTPRGRSTYRGAYKSAFLRRPYTDDQLRTIYRHLMLPRAIGLESGLELFSIGGAGNARPVDATALPARDVCAKVLFAATWHDPADEPAAVAWLRELYRELYKDTGGAPTADGSYINYPDADLADPAYNTSGMPWHELYYGANYPRLQRIKAAWDPTGVFRHALSVQPPG